MDVKQIIFVEKNKAELLNSSLPEINENQVLVKTAYSMISSGTEKANITGDKNISIFDEEPKEATFPRAIGYSSSGTVVKVGANVKNFSAGDKVAVFGSFHKEYNVMNEDCLVKLDKNASLKEAAISYLSTFPLAAIRKTRLEAGESMLIMGLGALGLVGVHLARICGAVPIIAVDPVKERREKALKFGADYALDPFEEGFSEKVKALTDGGANTAIEVTGLGVGLEQCLDCMAKLGRVALLGCTRDKNFTIDYYRKVHGPGISLIGAHTAARPSLESSAGLFTAIDDMKTVLKFQATGRTNYSEMIDEIVSPKDCFEVYTRLVTEKNFPNIVLFDWENM